VPYYDHNQHYSRLLLDAIPDGCLNALDVGCGDGRLVRRIAERTGTSVVGIDRDARILERAREATSDPSVRFIETDFMSYSPDVKFDFVCAVASVHHMPYAAALEKLAGLLRPGGVLTVLGLYRTSNALDLAVAGLAVPVNTVYSLRSDNVESDATTRPPQMSLREIRTTSTRLLPNVRVRRLLLWRYLLTWTAPEAANAA
jgi:SAM-dependent methyltransferase